MIEGVTAKALYTNVLGRLEMRKENERRREADKNKKQPQRMVEIGVRV
jgi:hypothetical protein